MLQIKIFDEEHEKDLEYAVNSFLGSMEEEDVKGIQYRVAVTSTDSTNQIYCFSAMIIYRA
jgi:Sporulation protein Cse60